jgi:hypothetical protein
MSNRVEFIAATVLRFLRFLRYVDYQEQAFALWWSDQRSRARSIEKSLGEWGWVTSAFFG